MGNLIRTRRDGRALEALLVLAAPLLLLSVGVVAYLPEHDLIQQGWYVNVGELPLWWGIICGGIVVVTAETLYRMKSARPGA